MKMAWIGIYRPSPTRIVDGIYNSMFPGMNAGIPADAKQGARSVPLRWVPAPTKLPLAPALHDTLTQRLPPP